MGLQRLGPQMQAAQCIGLGLGQTELPGAKSLDLAQGITPGRGARDRHVHQEIAGGFGVEQQARTLPHRVDEAVKRVERGGVPRKGIPWGGRARGGQPLQTRLDLTPGL